MTPAALVGNGLKAQSGTLVCLYRRWIYLLHRSRKNTDLALCTSGRGHLLERRLKLVFQTPECDGTQLFALGSSPSYLACMFCYWTIRHSPVHSSKHTTLPDGELQKTCRLSPSNSKILAADLEEKQKRGGAGRRAEMTRYWCKQNIKYRQCT